MKPFKPQELPIRDIEWEPLIPLIGRANRSLALYDGILYGVPNPEVLLSPLTTREAVLSSRIEGTQATLSEVLKSEAGEEPEHETRRQDIVEIVNYRRALVHGEKALAGKPFNLNLLLELHSILLESAHGRNMGRGRFRNVQNWIGEFNSPIERAEFVPPAPEALMPALDAWEKHYHAESPDGIVQIAVIHAQFEVIHPFLDGNGRLGRIVIPLFLAEKGLLSRPMFYLSSYLERHRDEYIAGLRGIGRRSDGWNRWIGFFLRAVEEEARANADKAKAIIDLYADLKERVLALTRSQYAIPLLDQMFERPLFGSRMLRFPDGIAPSRQVVSGLLRQLRDNGILKVVRDARGRRPQILALAELVDICEREEAV